jgi:DNA-3-methyladenine glycosylase II
MNPDYWNIACAELSQSDPIIKNIILKYSDKILTTNLNPIYTLFKAIIGQQISVKAADSVWGKLIKLVNDQSNIEKIIDFPDEVLRAEVGISRQKIRYLNEIVNFREQLISLALPTVSRDEAYQKLITIKGIGPWTAQMFLIFCRMDGDEFPIGDVGLINAIKLNYQVSEIEMIKELGDTWRPYRTVATWYLWRTIDNEPVNY